MPHGCTQVSHAVLVELPGGAVSQEDTTRMALRHICPAAALTVLPLELL